MHDSNYFYFNELKPKKKKKKKKVLRGTDLNQGKLKIRKINQRIAYRNF